MKQPGQKAGYFVIGIVNVVCVLLLTETFLMDERQRDLDGIRNRLKADALISGQHFDGRSKFEVVRDLRATGQHAFPTFAPGLERGGIALGPDLYPLTGISSATTVFCNENGTWTVYQSDEHGFNNPLGLSARGTAVVVIGDSFVHGGCVAPGEDIAGQLRSRGVRALNLGIASTGPLAYLASLTEYAAPLMPPYVLLVFFAGDIRQLPNEVDGSAAFRRYLQTPGFTQHLADRQSLVDSLLRQYLDGQHALEGSVGPARRSIGRIRAAVRSFGRTARLHNVLQRIRCFGRCEVQEPDAARKLLLFEQVITAARDKIRGWHGQLVFVYVPDWYSYGRSYDSAGVKTGPNYLLRQDVLRIVAGLGVPAIDAQALVFDSNADPLALFNFRTYGHYNRQGYAAIAEQLALFLKRDMTASPRRAAP